MFRPILIGSLLILVSCSAWCGPDPMRPVVLPEPPPQLEESVEPSHWRLKLIRQSGKQRIALLNGRLVKVGGRIDGALVTAIQEHKVILQLADDRPIELTLPSINIRHGKY